MSIFIVQTPVPEYTGESAGIGFNKGRAEVDASTDEGLSALRYFRGAGYRISPKDENGASLAELLDRPADPIAEAAAIDAEIKQLKTRRDLDAKRDELAALRREVLGEDEAAALEPGAAEVEVSTDDGDQGEAGDGAADSLQHTTLLAPPAGNASVDDWRGWAVASGRATPEEAAGMSRTKIVEQYGADYDRDREAQLKGGDQA